MEQQRKTWEYAKTRVHDASGIDNPRKYMWYELNGVWYPDTKTVTLDLTPTWQSLLPALLAVIEDGSAEGRKEAIVQLKEMARGADQYRHVALLKDLKPEDNKMEKVVEVAQQIFWDVVSLNYPEVKTGDLPPDAAVEFDSACNLALDRWLLFNHPDNQ